LPPAQFFCARKDPRIHQPLTFLSQQSFGYCPRAKRSRSNTHAGVSDTSSRRRTMRSRLCGNRGLHTYVRASSAASSSVRTVTSRARRRGGLNTKSVMPWELARHIRSSGGTRSHANVDTKLCQFRHYFEATSWRWREDQSAPGPSVLPPLAGFPKKKPRRNGAEALDDEMETGCCLFRHDIDQN